MNQQTSKMRKTRLARLLPVAQLFGIMAAIVAGGSVLRLTQHASGSQQSRDATLAECLRYLRTQICMYSLEHQNISPGFPGNDFSQAADARVFVEQMTQYTDVYGRPSMQKSETRNKGPYLIGVPANPMTLRNGVMIVSGTELPRVDDSKAIGWFYNPVTRQIWANIDGADSQGVSYASY